LLAWLNIGEENRHFYHTLKLRAITSFQDDRLLVTSRQQLQTGHSFHLDRLPRAEAMALLQAYAPRLTDEQASCLAELCGDLPVALKTAGGYLKAYRAKPVTEYLAELEQNRLRRLTNLDQSADDVNLVFDASFRVLSESERRAWTALAVMPVDFNREAGKEVIAVAVSEASAPDLLDRLVHLNLLEYAEGNGRYGWHDLLRDFAAARLPKEEAEHARVEHAEYFSRVAEYTDKLYKQEKEQMRQGLMQFDQEREHLEAAFGFLSDHPQHTERLFRLINGVVNTGGLRFHPRQRILWLEAQLKAAQRVHDPYQECASLGNLGSSYFDLGRTMEAIECYKQQLVIARKIGFWIAEGNALSGLGISYLCLNKPTQAIKYHKLQLAITRKKHDKRREGQCLCNMGNAYLGYKKQSKAINAVKYFNQALVISRNTDPYSEGQELGGLGLAYHILGQPSMAIEFYKQGLVIHRNIGDKRGEGKDLWYSALAYEALGKRGDAILLAEQGLAILEPIEDPNASKIREKLAQWRGEDGAA